ncbi:hypothetical protein HDU93_007596 [Gonapodya sp. JEL0774]|nr:hypothetical protein HDU93_007596 [Gonapodya sp. JEL0774]
MAAEMESSADITSARTPARHLPYRWIPRDTFSHSCALAPALHSRLLAHELASIAREGKAVYDPNVGGSGMELKKEEMPVVQTDVNVGTRTSGPVTIPIGHFPFHEKPPPIHSFTEERGGSPIAEHGRSFYTSSWAYRHLVQAFDRISSTPGACDLGQLTDRGKVHLESIGRLLRDRYVDRLGYLPARLESAELLHIQSSDYARVMESTQYLLAGLYPSAHRLPSLHLTVHVRPMDTEFIYNPPSGCARLTTLYRSFRSQLTASTRPHLSRYESAYPQYLAPDAVIIPGSPEEAAKFKNTGTHHDVYDASACLMGEGKEPLPGMTRDQVKEMGRVLAGVYYGAYGQSPETIRLSMGRLVNRITERLELNAGRAPAVPVDEREPKADVRRRAEEKLAVWSGHDATIAPLLIALKAWDGHWPEFGSNVIFELLEDTSPTTTSPPPPPSRPRPPPPSTPYSARHSILNWRPNPPSSPPSPDLASASPTSPRTHHYVRVLHNLRPLELPTCTTRHPQDGSLCELGSFLSDVVGSVRIGDARWEGECGGK